MKHYSIKGNIPSKEELKNLWENLNLEKINNWTKYTNTLIDSINDYYSNGGIKINKYKILGSNPIHYYLLKDKNFVENIYKNKLLLEDRNYLKLDGELPKLKIIEHWTDIYTLAGDLARIMGYGGAYKKAISSNIAWKIAIEFVENELENRFEEFDVYMVKIENAKWFYDVAWDYSFIITDNKKHEIIFMDITDTD